MVLPKLQQELRAYRKKSGLSQRELAFLLGSKTKNQVSRYERRRYAPPLHVALALEALFQRPVSKLFPDLYDSAEKELRRRARALSRELYSQVERSNRSLPQETLQRLVEAR